MTRESDANDMFLAMSEGDKVYECERTDADTYEVREYVIEDVSLNIAGVLVTLHDARCGGTFEPDDLTTYAATPDAAWEICIAETQGQADAALSDMHVAKASRERLLTEVFKIRRCQRTAQGADKP